MSGDVAVTLNASSGDSPTHSGPSVMVLAPEVTSLEVYHCQTETEKTQTLKARDYKDPQCVCYEAEGFDCYNLQTTGQVGRTLTTPSGGLNEHIPTVCYGLDRASFNQGQNAKYDFSVEEEKAQTIVSRGPGGYSKRR